MDELVEQIMGDSDYKNRFYSADTSSIVGNDDESLLSLIDHISSGKANLLDLVIMLEKYHTQGSVEQRTKAIGIIGTIIYEVANLGLDSKAVVALSQFFISKLKDLHGVFPAVRSIYAILKFHASTVKDSQRKGDRCLSIILEGISSPSLHVPAYNQKVRNTAFKSYEAIMNDYTEFLHTDPISSDVGENTQSNTIPYTNIVSTVLTAIESEKDPRNLIMSFELSRLLLHQLGNSDSGIVILQPFMEEIFEIISGYYPIEFEPPKNDKFKITSKELKDRLNNCFVASPAFSALSFPFILEKLTSITPFTKIESLRTLQRMINELPIQKVRQFCEIIWNHLQNEAFNSFEETVQPEGINTLAQLCAVLTNTKERFGSVQFDSITERVISEVFSKGRDELVNDPDTLTGILAANILTAIMKNSATLCCSVIETFVVHFAIGMTIDDSGSSEDSKMGPRFQLVSSLLETFYSLTVENKESILMYLDSKKEEFMLAISKGIGSSLPLNKLKGVRMFRLLATNNYFSSEEVAAILAAIRRDYRMHTDNVDFMRDVLQQLKEVANHYPYETHACFSEDVEVQYNDFKDWRMKEDIDSNMQSEDPYKTSELYTMKTSLGLDVYMFLSEMETFCRTKECINDILFLGASDFYTNLYVDNDRHHVWTKEYLEGACRLVDDIKLGQQETDEVVEKMMEKIFVESKNIFETSNDPVFMPKEFAEPFYHLLRQSIKTLSKSKAEILLSETMKVFTKFQPEFESRVKCYDKICNKKSYYGMNMSLFKIFKYLLKFKEISIWEGELFFGIFGFLDMLSSNSINTPALNNLKKESNKSLCILANKSTLNMPELDELINSSLQAMLDLMTQKKESLNHFEEGQVAKAFSLIKGLGIKGSPKSFSVVGMVIENLKDTSDGIRENIAKHWQTLFSPHDFSRKNKFNISPFYKQRLFSIAFPALLESYKKAQESMQNGEDGIIPLPTVSRLIIPICSESSYELYKDYLGDLLPLIVYSLSIDDKNIKEICLKMIKKLLEQEDHQGLDIPELTGSLVQSLDRSSSTFVKNLTLIGMDTILLESDASILKYREGVIAKAKMFLDDKKRSTRKLAVKCVNDWSIA